MREFKVLSFDSKSEPEDIESQLNCMGAQGYELDNSFYRTRDTVFVMSKKIIVRGTTAYPSDKQKGYIGWAYKITPEEVDKYKLTRKECSALIAAHSEEGRGVPYKKKALSEDVKDLRGVSEDFEFDDNLPF